MLSAKPFVLSLLWLVVLTTSIDLSIVVKPPRYRDYSSLPSQPSEESSLSHSPSDYSSLASQPSEESLLSHSPSDSSDGSEFAPPQLEPLDVQTGGHRRLAFLGPSRDTVLKVSGSGEKQFYVNAIASPLARFMPAFKGEIRQCLSVFDAVTLLPTGSMDKPRPPLRLDRSSASPPQSPGADDDDDLCLKLENVAFGYLRPTILNVKLVDGHIRLKGLRRYDIDMRAYSRYETSHREWNLHSDIDLFVRDAVIPFLTLSEATHALLESEVLSQFIAQLNQIIHTLTQNPNIILNKASLLFIYEAERSGAARFIRRKRILTRKPIVRLIDFEESIFLEKSDVEQKNLKLDSFEYSLSPLKLAAEAFEQVAIDKYELGGDAQNFLSFLETILSMNKKPS